MSILSDINMKYKTMIMMVGLFFLVEFIVSFYVGSLSLRTDAFHMLSDVLALCIGLYSNILSKKDKNNIYSYGWIRSEIIGGLINCIFLLSLCFSILIEIIYKIIELSLYTNEDKLANDINLVLITGGIGLFINIIGMLTFHQGSHGHSHGSSHGHSHGHASSYSSSHGHSHGSSHGHSHNQSNNDIELNFENVDIESRNIQAENIKLENMENIKNKDVEIKDEIVNYNQSAVMLHIIGDFLGSIVVILTGLMIKYCDGYWKFYFDPLASLFIIIFISFSNYKLLMKCIHILLHRSPIEHNDIHDELKSKIDRVDGVEDVHELHIWSLDNEINVASLHYIVDQKNSNSLVSNNLVSNDSISNHSISNDVTIRKIKDILHSYGIHSSTIQPEYSKSCIEPLCNKKCNSRKCCHNK
jgi:solute carrier family 30 (zinc transporter), member 1